MLTGKDIINLTALGAGTYLLKSAFNRLSEYDLKNKTVLITGASRGLGLVMAREFAREGSRLVLCARDEKELEQARLDLESLGAEVTVIPCDIRNQQDVKAMIAAIYTR